MSSQPVQQQPPPMAVTQEAYSSHSGGGSVGPVIAVLAVIAVLGIIAGMIGRLCAGGRIFGHGRQYDFEGWIERKCGSCIDGRVEVELPRPPSLSASDGAGCSSHSHGGGAARRQAPCGLALDSEDRMRPAAR